MLMDAITEKPWRRDVQYGGMSDAAAEASWRATQRRREEDNAFARSCSPPDAWEPPTEIPESSDAGPDVMFPASASPTLTPRFVPVSIDDVTVSAEPAWLIDGLLPARGLACIVGPRKAARAS
jgi:hypothetical protein